MKVKSLIAREVIDSRAKPTVEAEVNGFRAICPSGASKGKYEAVEMRDGGKRFNGQGVQRAVDNVNKIIAKKAVGLEFDQKKFDALLCELAGSNKWKLGGNATTAVSMAFCRASGILENVKKLSGSKMSIPIPFMNVLNGGMHAGNDLAIQEFMIVPHKFSTFRESLQAGCEIYSQLKEILKEKYGKTAINVGDEGGFAPPLSSTRDALSLLWNAIDESGYGGKVGISIDAAASQFFGVDRYSIDGKTLSSEQMIEYYLGLSKSYPIFSIEDPFNEEDFHNFAELKKKAKFMVVGDDLTVTNITRIKKAVELDSCNVLLVKINQIGTVSEAIESVKLARKDDWNIIVSHRSGDTFDPFIADFAVGLGAMGAKFGAPCRAERTEKYNQLLRLEEETKSAYVGKTFKKL